MYYTSIASIIIPDYFKTCLGLQHITTTHFQAAS